MKKKFLAFVLPVVCILASFYVLIDYLFLTKKIKLEQEKTRLSYYEEQEIKAEPLPEQPGMPLPEVSFKPPIQEAEPSFTKTATQLPSVAQPRPTPQPGMNPRFVSLYKHNADVVGWLKIEGIGEIDFPVVRRDNSFYVDHDFYGKKSREGAVFLDAACAVLPQSDNLIFHGHNMKNGTMLGKLARLLDRGVLLNSLLLHFDSLYESEIYIPYAISVISADPGNARFFSFVQPNFQTEEAREGYVTRLMEPSSYEFAVDVINSDQLLTIGTCHGGKNDERLVIGYRRLRENETPQAAVLQIQKHLKVN